ncbi:MAG: hypothetical protein SGPRY_002835, partial [Prymnesium sp.]
EVISAKLVDFRDIAGLQQQNMRLLQAMRKLGEEHEREIAAKEEATDSTVSLALKEVEELRAACKRQEEAVRQLAQQRDMYKSLQESKTMGGVALLSPPDDSMAGARAAAEAEVDVLKEELDRLRAGSAETESQLSSSLDRARGAEHEARVNCAQAEARAVMFEAKVKALEEVVAGCNEWRHGALQAEGTLSGKLMELQGELRARGEELTTSQAETRRQSVLATTSKQELELAKGEVERLRDELSAQASSKVQLQQLLEQMQQMQESYKASEMEASKRLVNENDELRKEWAETKAALYKEREAAAEARREAEMQAASAHEQLQVSAQGDGEERGGTLVVKERMSNAAAREVGGMREESAKLVAQLETMRQLHDTLQLQLREKHTPSSNAAASGLPEELASTKRALKQAGHRATHYLLLTLLHLTLPIPP